MTIFIIFKLQPYFVFPIKSAKRIRNKNAFISRQHFFRDGIYHILCAHSVHFFRFVNISAINYQLCNFEYWQDRKRFHITRLQGDKKLYPRVFYILQNLSVNASIFTLTAIAVDRYKAIIYPLSNHASKQRTKVGSIHLYTHKFHKA